MAGEIPYHSFHEPKPEKLGLRCQFWDDEEHTCAYHHAHREGVSRVAGRVSCFGIIDDVCLLRPYGRRIQRLSDAENERLESWPATYDHNRLLPEGEAN